jgi:hypothetical protein
MPNVAELIRDHVTLEVECVDRLYLNGYIATLQTPGQLVCFLTRHRGHCIPSPKLLGDITQQFHNKVKRFARSVGIPIVEFTKGERKDDIAKSYHARFRKPHGVVFIGVAQEKAWAFKAKPIKQGKHVHFDYSRQSVCVTHYYFYLLDPQWGPAFLKVCSYAPFTMKLCLNGHEWLKRQLKKAGIPFEALDNGILSCANLKPLKALCERLKSEDIQSFFDRWLKTLPMPLTPQELLSSFRPRLSILQMEVSLTQVFDRPLRGREFFEEVIREQIDLGRPDRIQILFDRKVIRSTPGRFRTRIIRHGVAPSLNVQYKKSTVKQYFKEERALRTETIINDPRDFGIQRSIKHFDYLRSVGRQVNRRLLRLEEVAHDCTLKPDQLRRVVLPSVHQGKRASGLRFGEKRAMALFAALSTVVPIADGITNGSLRPLVEQFLGAGAERYSSAKMSYDLRRLILKGALNKLPGHNRYVLTAQGRRWALFFTKTYARIFRPAFQMLEPAPTHSHQTPLTKLFGELDKVVDNLVQSAKLAA